MLEQFFRNRPGKCNAFPKDSEKSPSCATAAAILLGENLQGEVGAENTQGWSPRKNAGCSTVSSPHLSAQSTGSGG